MTADDYGQHGTLHLKADGSYTYQSFANNISSDATDVFVYTLKDGDGDLSTTTLTINLADVTLVAPPDNDVTVNEAALDLRQGHSRSCRRHGDRLAAELDGGDRCVEPAQRDRRGWARCTTSWSAAATR